MVRSPHESFSSFQRPGSPFLHPTSDSFGSPDGTGILGHFLSNARSLRDQLLRLYDDLGRGSISVAGFVERASLYTRSSFYVAYSLGAHSIFPFYTLTDRDVRILDEALNEEVGFLQGFARDIARGELYLDPGVRAGLYLLALRGIFERGRLEAMPQGPYDWALGITEHCTDCSDAARNGPYQRDHLSGMGLPPLPGTPGDGSVCQGLTRCGCTIVLSSDRPLPNQELAEQMRGLLLEVANGSSSSFGGAETG